MSLTCLSVIAGAILLRSQPGWLSTHPPIHELLERHQILRPKPPHPTHITGQRPNPPLLLPPLDRPHMHPKRLPRLPHRQPRPNRYPLHRHGIVPNVLLRFRAILRNPRQVLRRVPPRPGLRPLHAPQNAPLLQPLERPLRDAKQLRNRHRPRSLRRYENPHTRHPRAIHISTLVVAASVIATTTLQSARRTFRFLWDTRFARRANLLRSTFPTPSQRFLPPSTFARGGCACPPRDPNNAAARFTSSTTESRGPPGPSCTTLATTLPIIVSTGSQPSVQFVHASQNTPSHNERPRPLPLLRLHTHPLIQTPP